MAKRRKSRASDETFTQQIAIRLTDEDHERLSSLAGVMPLSVLARRAIVVGLDAIEADPSLLLGSPKKRGR